MLMNTDKKEIFYHVHPVHPRIIFLRVYCGEIFYE